MRKVSLVYLLSSCSLILLLNSRHGWPRNWKNKFSPSVTKKFGNASRSRAHRFLRTEVTIATSRPCYGSRIIYCRQHYLRKGHELAIVAA